MSILIFDRMRRQQLQQYRQTKKKMNYGVFTYLRSSTLLRALSALTLVVLTGSSVAADVCSNCSIQATEIVPNDVCPMSQAGEEVVVTRSFCCCSQSEKKPSEAPKSSCCSESGTEKTTSASQLSKKSAKQVVGAIAVLQDFSLPRATSGKQATCNHQGPCSYQLQSDSHPTSPPPPRSIEQQQDNLTLTLQTRLALTFIVRLPNRSISILPCEPPTLSGIGSQLLLC